MAAVKSRGVGHGSHQMVGLVIVVGEKMGSESRLPSQNRPTQIPAKCGVCSGGDLVGCGGVAFKRKEVPGTLARAWVPTYVP
jgi:hypothetical protein